MLGVLFHLRTLTYFPPSLEGKSSEEKWIERKEQREVAPSTDIMETTNSIVDPGNAEDSKTGLSMALNETPPQLLDSEKLTDFSDFHVEQKHHQDFEMGLQTSSSDR